MQLSEKYRPSAWSDFIGQDKAIARLRATLGLPTFDRGAFLLIGPSASGKTSAAHVIASTLGCTDVMNTVEIKGQDCTVDELRRLSQWFQYYPPTGRYKVAIVNECHAMTSAAATYALELMERPPANRVIVLTTTEPDWCAETLWSRFYAIRFAKPHSKAIVEHLRTICEREGFTEPDNVQRFVAERHNNIRRCLNDLEIEAAVAALAA